MARQAAVGDFAFWTYNSGFGPSTYLGSEIIEVEDNGIVRVKGYGNQNRFKPCFTCPLAEGQALFDKLKAAEQRHKRMINDANASFIAARDSLFKKD